MPVAPEVRAERRARRVATRRQRLVHLAESIALLAGGDLEEFEVRRLLDSIVRRWSDTEAHVYSSVAAAEAGTGVHREHVLPARVIVDRMILNPSDCESLLTTGIVLARVTRDEHRQIGTMMRTHRDLYDELQTCGLDELVTLAWDRYRVRGVEVFDEKGRSPFRRRRRSLRGS